MRFGRTRGANEGAMQVLPPCAAHSLPHRSSSALPDPSLLLPPALLLPNAPPPITPAGLDSLTLLSIRSNDDSLPRSSPFRIRGTYDPNPPPLLGDSPRPLPPRDKPPKLLLSLSGVPNASPSPSASLRLEIPLCERRSPSPRRRWWVRPVPAGEEEDESSERSVRRLEEGVGSEEPTTGWGL